MVRCPPGSIDTHVHVFDPQRFPYVADTPYRPVTAETATPGDLAAVLDAAGVDRVVIVNPTSGYGLDNGCMLAALDELGQRARGIARVPLDAGDAMLDTLARRRVVGVRIDFIGTGATVLGDAALPRLLDRLAERDLVCAMQAEAQQWIAIAPIIAAARVRVVIDHCGRPDVTAGIHAPAFGALLRLAGTQRVAVKLSGPMRFSRAGPPYRDTDAFYAAVAGAFGPTRLMWGSDWPFLRSERRLDYGPALAHLARIVPDDDARRHVLAITPSRWFGFDVATH